MNIYQGKTSIKTQSQFNNFFKGIYASHSFNEGAIIKISVAGIMVYYSYNAMISTTYNGKDTTINSADLKNDVGAHYNPLVSSIFISANSAVERVNLIDHIGLKENFSNIINETNTYTFTPAGLYTTIQIPSVTQLDQNRSAASVRLSLLSEQNLKSPK